VVCGVTHVATFKTKKLFDGVDMLIILLEKAQHILAIHVHEILLNPVLQFDVFQKLLLQLLVQLVFQSVHPPEAIKPRNNVCIRVSSPFGKESVPLKNPFVDLAMTHNIAKIHRFGAKLLGINQTLLVAVALPLRAQ
jgi:hypothetical protein